MRSQILIRRYAQGLINSAKSETEFQSLYGELREFEKFLSLHAKLADTLRSPFLPITKKMEIAERVMERTSLGKKAKRFMLLLVENNRLTILQELLETLPYIWNEEHGISTFQVSSVVPLNRVQKKRLEDKLAFLENQPVSLTYKIDPSLIGGLSIQRGNVIYDASIRGDLERLKQKIAEE